MENSIGIRLEDKNRWERRSPLIPDHVAGLVRDHGISFVVQQSDTRAFSAEEYSSAGAQIRPDLRGVPVVLGVKEMPETTFEKNGVYIFFSHTIKGQSGNMPMLRQLARLGCTLIDYERIEDDDGRRLVFFGKWAGTAGMIDSLFALGRRWQWEGFETPLSALTETWRYADLAEAQEAVSRAGERLKKEGLPAPLRPAVVAFLGYGNVSRGAQEILDLLPVEDVKPEDLENLPRGEKGPGDTLFKVVFEEKDLVVHREAGTPFDLKDYYQFPEMYRPVLSTYLPHLTAVMNCVYWDRRYPRFVQWSDLALLFKGEQRPSLSVIGDISCDLHGSVEATVRVTEPDQPVYVADPLTGKTHLGVEGRGVVILAVDNLPCELPRDASTEFSSTLVPFIPALAAQDFSAPLEALRLPDPLRRAIILHQGRLTQPFQYMQRFLKGD